MRLDRFEAGFLVVPALIVVALVGAILYPYLAHWNERCTHTHVEHRGAWVQYVQAGKAHVPIYHPARDVDVCDRWEKEP